MQAYLDQTLQEEHPFSLENTKVTYFKNKMLPNKNIEFIVRYP